MSSSSSSSSKTNCGIIVILVVSLLINVFFLIFARSPKTIVKEIIPAAEKKQIQEIAQICGSKAANNENTSVKELLFDIHHTILNTESCYEPVLNKKDLKTIKSYLNNKPEIIKTIEKQNKFISGLKGKKFIIFSK